MFYFHYSIFKCANACAVMVDSIWWTGWFLLGEESKRRSMKFYQAYDSSWNFPPCSYCVQMRFTSLITLPPNYPRSVNLVKYFVMHVICKKMAIQDINTTDDRLLALILVEWLLTFQFLTTFDFDVSDFPSFRPWFWRCREQVNKSRSFCPAFT